jgi:hypothetical protein
LKGALENWLPFHFENLLHHFPVDEAAIFHRVFTVNELRWRYYQCLRMGSEEVHNRQPRDIRVHKGPVHHAFHPCVTPCLHPQTRHGPNESKKEGDYAKRT